MLTSLLGIRLMLLTGKTVPLPAPYDAVLALTRVSVRNDTDLPGDGFEMTFTLTKESAGEYNLVRAKTFEPFNRVVIAVILGVTPEVLIDGVVTRVSLQPGTEPGTATMTVQGRDNTQMLDLEERLASYPNQPDFVIFSQIIGQYAQYGLIPSPTPTTDVPLIINRIPRQRETDLAFIRRMAERNGYVFYTEPLPFGTSLAYFGPENRVGLPQPPLTTNMGSFDNLKSISVSNDGMAPEEASATVLEPISKSAIPVPALPSLRVPPLAAAPVTARRKRILSNAASQNPGQASTSVIAAGSRAAEPVVATGEVDAIRYGAVMRARRLVGLRGVGLSFDGHYYVRSVEHVITPGSYVQQFRISREGVGSPFPAVRPPT